ncbi:MAG: polyprenyl synthetase family protein [Treponema sp.]|jgi:octaprenyl-diphosphate synthase|nr:polyprenyl synthetase family protein [Treponema sp.]
MDREYTREIEKIEAVLNGYLPAFPNDAWYGRIFPGLDLKPEWPENLIKPGRDLLKRGGKRWRPLLAHLLCRTLGGGDTALPLLPLIELSHTASLIHDDLEDNSGERRGQPAIHLLYGSDTAINSGSFLYFLPFVSLEIWEGKPEEKNKLWQLWAQHLRFLHLGQSMDIAWHRDPAFVPSIDEYMLMCGLKTGYLARFAALLGVEAARIALKTTVSASVAALNQELALSLGEAAKKLGIGFQILDDVKNLSTGIAGKKHGDDVVEGKKSLPVILYLQGKDGCHAFVQRCFTAAREGGADVPEVKEFIDVLTRAGVLVEAERQGKALISEAKTAFSALSTADDREGRLLAGLTELLI